jgi:transcriptional regulator with XRE-family HTH domain
MFPPVYFVEYDLNRIYDTNRMLSTIKFVWSNKNMARSKGSNKTPDRVVELLRGEVSRTSQAATARATGLTLKGVQNYLKGIGDPTTATLNKLAFYFNTSVAYLRGAQDKIRSRFQPGEEGKIYEKIVDDLLEIHAIIPDNLKDSLVLMMHNISDEIEELLLMYVSGVQEEKENEVIIVQCLEKLNSVFEKEN